MKTSLDDYRPKILESVLGLLWEQWVLLGIAGKPAPVRTHPLIIDPEALLLVSSEVARFDGRLFDEMIEWLRLNGRFINIQRLKSLHQNHRIGNGAVLAAISATLMETSRLAKWKAIESLAPPASEEEPLFRNLNFAALPFAGRHDPHFARFGLMRGPVTSRHNAITPRVERPEVLLVKLRALFGVHARAEIIAALLSNDTAHPSALARKTGYLPRSVQDLLNEMALSKHVLASRPPGSREKYFSLRPGDWTFLITWDPAILPMWFEWPVLFSLLQRALEVLAAPEIPSASPLMVALQLRKVFDAHLHLLNEAGQGGMFRLSAQESGLGFLEAFLKELSILRE